MGFSKKGYVRGHSEGKVSSNEVDLGVWEVAEETHCGKGPEPRMDVGVEVGRRVFLYRGFEESGP